MRRLLLAVALAGGLIGPAAGAAAASAAKPVAGPGTIGIRLLDAPKSEADDPRARAYIIDRLAPGAVINRRVEVSNTTAKTESVALYPNAAEIKGGTFVSDVAAAPGELSRWTTTNPTSVSLRPGARAPVMVTIKIPADAAPGERYGVVWASHTTAAPTGGGVTLVNRVGVRLYLSIGPGNAPASTFTVDGLVAQRAADGSPSVLAQVHNTGGRALDLSGDLLLSAGPGGLSAGPFPAQLGVTLAPGQSAPVTVLLDKQVPDGPWQATLTLRSGLLSQKTTATLRFPSGPGSLAATSADGGSHPALLIAVATAAAVLVAGLFFLLGRRRRSPDDGRVISRAG